MVPKVRTSAKSFPGVEAATYADSDELLMHVQSGYLGKDGVHGESLRRRASEDIARETFCSACSPRVRGRQYRVRGDVRARLLGELEASIDQTASDPTPTSDTIDYHSATPFSSYRVPHKRHK